MCLLVFSDFIGEVCTIGRSQVGSALATLGLSNHAAVLQEGIANNDFDGGMLIDLV